MVIFNLLHLLKEHRKNRETVSDPTQPIFVLTKSLLDDIVQSSDPLLSLGISLGLRAEWWALELQTKISQSRRRPLIGLLKPPVPHDLCVVVPISCLFTLA